MEFLFEFIGELLLSGLLEASTSKKVNKWIRYFLLIIIAVLFLSVFLGLIILSVIMFRTDDLLGGLMILGLDLFFIIGSIKRIKKGYIKVKNK